MKRVVSSVAWAIACLQAFALLSGCGGGSSSGGGGGTQTQQPSITSFTAGAVTIEATTSTTLTPLFTNGSGVVTPGNIAVTSGTAVSVTPTSTTIYTLTVTGGSGTTAATQTAQVTVDPVPTTSSFTAGAATIEAGTSTTLTASFSGGTGVIMPGNIAVSSGVAVPISPATSTSYTLTVSPPVGTITSTSGLTVTVDPVPTITSFTASPNPITSGSSTNLTAIFAGGTGTISPGNQSISSGTPLSVSPTTTTTYTLTVSPPVGTVTASQTTMVTVNPAATITSFTASPNQIESGSSTSLTSYFSGGSGVITGPGNLITAVTSGQLLSVTPPATTASATDTYTLTVTPTSGGTAATQSATVTVDPQPVITSFTAAVNPLVAGNSTSLTANFSGGTGVITPGASGGTTGSIAVTSGTAAAVNPTQTTTYTLTVTPPVGSAITQTLTLAVYPSVAVCLSNSCSGPAISNLLMGMNLAMWYDVTTNASPIVQAFQSAGVAAVRWPGGSNSDFYHWNGTATYPTIGAPSNCDSGYSAPNDTFTNFLSDIVTPANLDLAITADYGSDPACNGPGLASEAAGWAAAAVADGVPIHYMTVGNEEYGSWEYDLHTPAADQHNPSTYAGEMTGSTGFYSSIKAASPNTLVGVDVDANCTTSGGCTNGWDSTVLQQAAGSYDFVEYHYYPQNAGSESDTTLVQQAAQQFTTNINTIKSELQTAGEPSTPIYVGEIGSVSSNPGKQSWSITQGLYAGQILGEAMNDGVARLTWWIGFGNCNGDYGNMSSSLYGWQSFGAYNIFADGSGDVGGTNNSACSYGGNIGSLSPSAEAFNLAQNVLVAGQYPQQTAVVDGTGYTRAYAATTASGGTALMLFNLSETTPETVSVSLTGTSQTSSTGVTVMTYDKEIYDYTNTNCQADQPTCTYDATHNYSTAQWAPPTTTTIAGPVSLPLTLTLQPWSMNVVIVQP